MGEGRLSVCGASRVVSVPTAISARGLVIHSTVNLLIKIRNEHECACAKDDRSQAEIDRLFEGLPYYRS